MEQPKQNFSPIFSLTLALTYLKLNESMKVFGSSINCFRVECLIIIHCFIELNKMGVFLTLLNSTNSYV